MGFSFVNLTLSQSLKGHGLVYIAVTPGTMSYIILNMVLNGFSHWHYDNFSLFMASKVSTV